MGPLWILGGAGLLLLLLLAYTALLHLSRGTPLERIRSLPPEGRVPAVGDPIFRELVEDHLNSDITEGNRVEVLFDGEATYPRLFADLRAAERLIAWHVFWFRPGRLADELKGILVERARAGVTVLMLYDAWGGNAVPSEYWEELREAGIEVHAFRPLRWDTLYKFQRRSHIRSVIVDGRIGYTGGFAIADEWSGDGRHPDQWRDTSARLEGPIVGQLGTVFAAEWIETAHELLLGEHLFPREMRESHGSDRAGILHESPSVGSTEAERFFALSIAGARETLYITNAYFVPDDDFRALLADAVRRGVDVRVLTPGANSDEKVTWYAARAHYDELIDAGVRIYEYRPTMVHAKTLVADRCWSAIGSLNFDNRSMALNNEVTVLVQGGDVGEILHARFLEDLELADEVTADGHGARGRAVRLLETACVLLSRFI